MIYARAILPDPDHAGRSVAIDRRFWNDDEFDAWLDYAPDAVAATLVISDDKPLPAISGLHDEDACAAAPRTGSVPGYPHEPRR
jgi:hypothetical protein